MSMPLRLAGYLCLAVLALASGAAYASSEEVIVEGRNTILVRLDTLAWLCFRTDSAAGGALDGRARNFLISLSLCFMPVFH